MFGAYLVIEKGEPHTSGTCFELEPSTTLIGRPWESHHPEVTFTSLYVSKRHALIEFINADNHFVITDLGSKHGTAINDIVLEPHKQVTLKHGDRIDLAKGVAVLKVEVCNEARSGETLDLTEYTPSLREEQVKAGQLSISVDRREVRLAGKKINLIGKDLELLLLLYQNQNVAVSYDQIKKIVWADRSQDPVTGSPDVGINEINTLIYRLRKRLEYYGCSIVSIPRYGYILDLK